MRTTLTSKGQLTLPAEIRKRLRLKQGTQFEVTTNEQGQVVMTPVVEPDDPFAAWVGVLEPLPEGMSSAEFIRELRTGDE
ncbi:transcriptional regulator, AbrB family [Deinococcus aerius]|uniref:Transcriptional regulator, AbrB family n=1 Tax=Deinococcus aerius TaxID=200253 RepID=A0A2I9DUQ7_9DEIO|nr:AbrB/MazE/SpoVT family DNA-binding domain-containing protein [Deinococcus aerius]GBF04095.1 transcriptional regulator, AbrB family [Deinococcus aerius]